MKEYIEREAVIAALDDVAKDYADEHTFATDFAAAVVCELRDNKIAVMPAADVVERKRGEWKWNEYGQMFCNVCGEFPELAIEKPFCPTCGADMREVDHEI